MFRTRKFLLSGAIAALFLAGLGCGPAWTVVRQATTSPFAQTTTFIIEPVQFETLHVGGKPEAEWLAKKNAQQRAAWEEDKKNLDQYFRLYLLKQAAEKGVHVATSGQPGPGVVSVRAVVRKIDEGYFAGIVNQGAELDTAVCLTGPSGVIEEITFQARGMPKMTLSDRIQESAAATGQVTAEYLSSRVR